MRACACFFFSPFSFGTKSAKRRVVIESAYVIAVQTLTSEILVLSAGYSEFGLCPLSNAESGYLARSIAPGPARPSLHTLLQPGVLPDLGAMVEEQYCSSMQALNRIAGVNDDPSIAALNHPDVSEVIRQFAKNLPPKESVSPPIPPVDYFISVLASQQMERGGGGAWDRGRAGGIATTCSFNGGVVVLLLLLHWQMDARLPDPDANESSNHGSHSQGKRRVSISLEIEAVDE